MLKIDHPQVYIYSYQLSRKSKTEANSIWAWGNNICQYFSPESDLILPNEDLKPILSKANKFSHSNKINGSFRFCRLDDSEGILARIGSPETDENKDLEITELKEFNANETILSRSYDNWLGQTIFITYKSKAYQNSSKDFLRGVADECLKYLFPESQRPPFYRATKLFDSHIFEYSSPQGQLQVFVYRIDDDIEEKLRNILQPLFELFYHRHKITKAFLDSRNIHELANKLYTDIENTLEDLETKIVEKKERYLQELKTNVKELLHESLHYQKTLQALEDFDNTISIHVYNCQQKLSQISDKCEIQPEALTTFNLFIEKTSPYFQRQIQGDLGYFKHGTNLIETAIASIRGIVEIEQAESDRELQNTIQALGFGIGGAGVVATSTPYWIKQEPGVIDINKPLSFSALATFILIIFLSLGAGLITGKLANYLINGKGNNIKVKPQGDSNQNQPSLTPGQNADMSFITQQPEEVRSLTSDDTKIT